MIFSFLLLFFVFIEALNLCFFFFKLFFNFIPYFYQTEIRTGILNSFLNSISKSKSFFVVQLAPPNYVSGLFSSLKSLLAPSFFKTESFFVSNDDALYVNTRYTEILFKDIHLKRMDRVKIISIIKNLVRTVYEIFQKVYQLTC